MTRVVVALLSLALLVAPLAAEAEQAGRMYRIAFATLASDAEGFRPWVQPLVDGLRDLGYVEGRDFRLDVKYADNRPQLLPVLMAEHVQSGVDIIVAGPNFNIAAAKTATSSIPIVMLWAADPVDVGFVKSLAHPGGNITGLTADVTPQIAAKRLELLKESAPTITRVAVLWEPGYPSHRQYYAAASDAARIMGMYRLWLGRPGALPLRVSDILVVDDAAVVRHVCADLIRDLGHQVEVVAEAGDALGRLRNEPFDVLVTDIVLPGMDGWQLIAAATHEQPMLRLVAMTADVDGNRERALALGVPLLQKPFTRVELGDALQEALGART